MPDNFTKVPNWFFSMLLKEDLNGSEYKVYLCIIRHTFGYHEKTTSLSAYTIAKETMISVRSVERALQSLRSKNLIKTKSKMLENKVNETNKITLVHYGQTTDRIDGTTTDKFGKKPPTDLSDNKEIVKTHLSSDVSLDETILDRKENIPYWLDGDFDDE